MRQHLDALADHGLVASRTGPAEGRGRPPTVWALTDLAQDLFPDRHDDLTVELITAVRTALGDQGLAQVIDARAEVQRAAYERAVPKRGSLRDAGRSAGPRPHRGGVRRRGRSTIPTAAACCSSSTTARSAPRRPRVPGLCGSELELFREVLGPKVSVERTQHIVAGDRRCTYLHRDALRRACMPRAPSRRAARDRAQPYESFRTAARRPVFTSSCPK